MESRSDELYHVLCEKGYPDDFCREIAYRQMNTDYTATRMLGYLYRVSDPRPEDVVDEMLAILIDREAIIKKKELEHAQATINHVYREGLLDKRRDRAPAPQRDVEPLRAARCYRRVLGVLHLWLGRPDRLCQHGHITAPRPDEGF